MMRLIATGLLLLTTFAQNVQAQPAGPEFAPGNHNGQQHEQHSHKTYGEQEILTRVQQVFGHGAESLALAVQTVFREHGEPNGYIAGEEFGAAFGVGLRYGRGVLSTRNNLDRPIFWQGPSIGLDVGVNVAKVFILIYQLPNEEYLFQRFPGIEGSLYFVGGVGVNYLQSGDTVIAPIRLGAGWRQGVSAGYMDFTRRAHYNPF